MDIESNKQIAREFFARFSRRDLAGAVDLLADDATWWISGNPEQLPFAGDYDKPRITRMLQRMGQRLPHGLQLTNKHAIGEGDQLAVEAESYGELDNGRIYNQRYHFQITFRDGHILAVKEYLDTFHAHSVWVAPDVDVQTATIG